VPQDERLLLHKVFAQLRARTDRDFSCYKRSTVLRRRRPVDATQLSRGSPQGSLPPANADKQRALLCGARFIEKPSRLDDFLTSSGAAVKEMPLLPKRVQENTF